MGTPISTPEHMVLAETVPEASATGQDLRSFDVGSVPTQPGCYLMRDAKGTVVYVGKARNLRARIRTYLNENDRRYTVQFLMQRVKRIDFLVTVTDKEALLLENSLIKEHRPRYNIRLRDDKTYVSLRMNVKHAFPRLTVTRKIRRDGSRYFGPYSSAGAVRETLKQIQRVFPLRTCSDAVLRNRSRPCLYYQMGQCSAPCVGRINEADYREIVEQALLVLAGRSDEVEKRLRTQIEERAAALDYESAAVLRDRLYALKDTLERQRTVNADSRADVDVFGYYNEGRFSEIQVLYYRGGKLLGGRSFSFNRREAPMEELLSSLLLQYYADGPDLPEEVLVPMSIEDAGALAELLREERGGAVRIHFPQRGGKRALVDLAMRNAKTNFEEKRLKEKAQADVLEQIQKALDLPRPPQRIECFDISTTQGDKAVGAMAVVTGGAPDKQRYRRFSIKQVEGQDDFAMLREVLMRRYKRAIAEDDLPDLALIDGGKGQLNVAVTVMQDLGIDDLPVASIAKSRAEQGGGHSPERFFVPGRKNAVLLPQHGAVVRSLAALRDEAHRFAVTYHRKKRTKAAIRTPLVDIPGVGPERARRLLREMGSMARVKAATEKEIAAVPGFGDQLARTVKEYLNGIGG